MSAAWESHTVNQTYSNYIQPMNQDVFEILASRAKSLNVDLGTQRILDFGCNVGHLMTTAKGRIRPENYVGIDVNRAALEIAKQRHPLAQWQHYDCYNNVFNPFGIKGLEIPIHEKFDVVVCYGVFTHYFINEILETSRRLERLVRPGGLFIFSVWEDKDFYGYLGFLDRELGINAALAKPVTFENGFVLVNRNRILIDPVEQDSASYDWIESFYRPEFISKSIAGASRILGYSSKHPVYIKRC